MSPWRLQRIGKAFQRGAVIACPTDTIWGFACHPLSIPGIQKILDIKQRSWTKGLILLSSDVKFCMPYLSPNLTCEQIKKINQPADYPVTWVVPTSKNCPLWIRGNFSTVAIRITRHPFILALCEQIKSPIISTSANCRGRSPVRNSTQAHRQFADVVDFIVAGYADGTKRPSEIKSIKTGVIFRSAQ